MFSPHALGGRLDRYHDLSVRGGKHPLQGRSSLPVDISAMKTSTWTYKPAQLLAMPPPAAAGGDKQLRFRPEKAHRRPVQRLQWRRSVWSPQQDDAGYLDLNRVSSMTIADVSPKFAVKRIVMLHENLQYREAANFINRLSHGTFKVILCDLPVEVFIDSMPNSLPVLESLYAKVFLSDGLDFSLKTLKPEAVVMQMVKFFAQHEENAPGNLKLDESAPFAVSCKKLLKVIVHTDPKIKKMLLCRRKSVEKAIEGMGHHGMVGNADGSLMNLHDALKLEFQRVVSSYKAALETLEELSLSTNGSKQTLSRSISHGPAPIQVSHQRQLSITQQEIQDRLIKNKTILNVVEPILGSHSLDVFLGILQRRIEHDKDCLFQFTQLKKEVKDIGDVNVVAPVLMRYRHGIEQVLKLMREVTGDQEESEGSDISGYHSDSDSAIMTSGNSPYVSKSARYNFLYRSVRATPTQFRGALPSFSLPPASLSGTSAPSSEAPSEGGKSSDQVSTTSPIDTGSRARKRTDLATNSNNSCGASTSSENEVTCPKGHTLPLVAPPCGQKRNYESGVGATPATSVGSRSKQTANRPRKPDDISPRLELTRRTDNTACDDPSADVVVDNITHISIDNQSAALVNRYAQLHMQDRTQALLALDALPELRNSDELKSKLLFSVVVLAFRSVSCTQQQVRETVRRQLQIPPPPPDRPLPPGRPQDSQLQRSSQLESTLNRFLQQTVDTYDLSNSVEDVCRQIWATLYDYPSLRSSEGLLSYVKECVRLAWALINQTTPCRIEYEQRTFSGQLHVRHQCSDAGQSTVLSYLWPALVEPGTGCMYKAVVIT